MDNKLIEKVLMKCLLEIMRINKDYTIQMNRNFIYTTARMGKLKLPEIQGVTYEGGSIKYRNKTIGYIVFDCVVLEDEKSKKTKANIK